MITNTDLNRRGNQLPDHIVDHTHENENFTFTTKNGVILNITILRDSAVRFRYATDLAFEDDFSYAISDDVNLGYNELELEESAGSYIIKTSKIKVFVTKENLKIFIEDLDGQVICEDDTGFIRKL